MSKQINKKTTFLIRIDYGWWKILSQLKTDYEMPFRELVEYALSEMYGGVNAEDLDKHFGEVRDVKR